MVFTMTDARLQTELAESKNEIQRLHERLSMSTPKFHKELSLISLVVKGQVWSIDGQFPGPKIQKSGGGVQFAPPNLGPFGVSCPFLKISKFLVWTPEGQLPVDRPDPATKKRGMGCSPRLGMGYDSTASPMLGMGYGSTASHGRG